MASNSHVNSLICLKSELVQGFIVVLITCKSDEDAIKTRYRPYKILNIYVTLKVATSLAHSRQQAKINFVRDFMTKWQVILM